MSAPEVQIFDTITQEFMTMTQKLYGGIQSFGIHLAVLLVLIQFMLHVSKDILNGKADAMRIMFKAINALMILAIIYYLITNVAVFLPDLFNTATQLGLQGTGVTSLDPSSVVNIGESISAAMLKGVNSWGVLTEVMSSILAGFSSITCLLAFAFIAADLMFTLIVTYFYVSMSGIFIAFGANAWTLPIAKEYFSGAIGVSVKLMMLYMMITIAVGLTPQWMSIAVQSSQAGDWSGLLGVAACCMVFWYLSKKIPELFAGIASRSLGISYIGDTQTMMMGMVGTGMAASRMVLSSKAATASTIQNINNHIGAAASSLGSTGGMQNAGATMMNTASNASTAMPGAASVGGAGLAGLASQNSTSVSTSP